MIRQEREVVGPAAHAVPVAGARDDTSSTGTEVPAPAVGGAGGAEAGVSLRLEGLRKAFGACVAVDGVTLDVREGELLAILGPSGCGKSTLLRLVAGLERQDAGRVVLHGRDVGRLPPAARGCGVVFQSYALFPNLTAADNVAFGIDGRHNRRQRADRAAALLEQVGLSDAARKYPAQLSGGQQQRVALARALATEPSLLLLDEPLSALDAKVRAMLRLEIRRLQQATRLTTLLVTHDQEEALTMADRVAVMNGGRLVQVGTPRSIYQRPADAFTAAFVGVMNFLDGWTVEADGSLRRDGVVLRAADAFVAPAGTPLTVAFRPEEAALKFGGGCGDNLLPCRVERIEFRGSFVRFYARLRSAPRTGNGSGVLSYERPEPPVDPTADSALVLIDLPDRDAREAAVMPGALAELHVAPESVRVFPVPGALR